ncbi:MAG: sigma-70 family RNA polymerase sigma factor [bacterium]
MSDIEETGKAELETIMAEHESALLRYAARLVNDPGAAQDVVQDTFLKLLRGWTDGARPTRSLTSWLYRVTHNHAVDYIRRENRLKILHRAHLDASPDTTPPQQHKELERKDALRLALEHVRQLDPAEQQIVILRLQEGMPYQQISEITGQSESNVGFILHHAVKKLSKSLAKAGMPRRFVRHSRSGDGGSPAKAGELS